MPVETELAKHTDYPRYQSYVLRLWQERPSGPWRARLQAVGSEEAHGFPEPTACFAFIRAQLPDEREGGGST